MDCAGGDINAYKEENKRLKYQVMMFDAALRSMSDYVQITDKEKKIFFSNLEALDGIPNEQVIGKHVDQVYISNHPSATQYVYQEKQPVHDYYTSYTTKGGREINNICSESYPIIHNDELFGLIDILKSSTRMNQLLESVIQWQNRKSMKNYRENTFYSFSDFIGTSRVPHNW